MNVDESVEKLTRRAVHTLFRWKWLIMAIFACSFLLMLLAALLVTPNYRAANRVLVSHNYKQQLSLFSDVVSPGQLNARVNYNNNFIRILQGELIADQIVREFELDQRLEQKKENPEGFREVAKQGLIGLLSWPIDFAVKQEWIGREPKDWHAKAVEDFMEDGLDIQTVEDTEIIEIGVYEASPELANAIADRLTELLTERLLELNRSEASLAFDYALEKSEEAEQEYIRSQDALEKMKQELRVTSFEDEKRLMVEHKEHLEEQLTLNAAVSSEISARIDESRKQLLEERLSPMKKTEVNSSISSLQIDLAGAQGRRTTIQESLKEVTQKIDTVILEENAYLALKNEVDFAARMYFQLREKTQELAIQQKTNTGEFGIDLVDRRHVPKSASPDSPKLVILFPMILIFSLGISLGLPFLFEFMSDFPLSKSEVSELTGSAVMGVVPRSRKVKRLANV